MTAKHGIASTEVPGDVEVVQETERHITAIGLLTFDGKPAGHCFPPRLHQCSIICRSPVTEGLRPTGRCRGFAPEPPSPGLLTKSKVSVDLYSALS